MAVKSNVVIQVEKEGPLEIREVMLPDPSPHQVIVSIIATGLCQSQIMWTHLPRTRSMLFGHEGYGLVAKVGAKVIGLREGDPVVVTWLPRIGADGRPAEISTLEVGDGTTAAAPNVYTWADYTLVDELFVKKLTGKHSDATSIVGCAVITGAGAVLNSAEAKRGDRIAVFGAGGVGLCAMTAAKIVEHLDVADIAEPGRFSRCPFGLSPVCTVPRGG